MTQSDTERQPKLEKLAGALGVGVAFHDDFVLGPVGSGPFLDDQQGSIIAVFTATQQGEGYGLTVGGDDEMFSTVINPRAEKGNHLAGVINDPELFTDEERSRYEYLTQREKFANQHLKRLQPAAMSLRHSFGPPYEPGVPVSRVMIRGEYDNPGEVVEAGFPSCITGHQEPAAIRLDPFKRWPTRSRRMALASWIADKNNPLTARVLMNCLWHWHFGRGIVPSPSDFGQLSGGPSHPELLDWLANRFVEENWSIKSMHRLMVNSNTYRQSSLPFDDRAMEIDPDNKLLWRFRRKRLEAEAVRDAVLAVSGRLNPEQNGLPIFPPLPGDVGERVKYSESKWDTQYGPEARKRSIYIYQQRTLAMPFMQVLDALVCDESRPRRRSSVTPLQALAMYNGNLVNEESRYFAERIRSEVGDDVQAQVERAFLLALSRHPTSEESRQIHQLVAKSEPREGRLIAMCRVLYNANEFVYVD